MKVELFKEETRSDAEYPQEQKYPSGAIIATGYLLDDELPKVESMFFMERVNGRWFRTSTVKEILEETKEYIRFKTRNSIYRLTLNP